MLTKEQPPSGVEIAFDRALTELGNRSVVDEEYELILNRIAKLHKMKEDEKPSQVSKDTLAMIGANLAGILLIIVHERVHVITSKALGFVAKPR